MLSEDKKMLDHLVKEYSTIEMLGALALAFREHRDTLSDLGLKERVLELSETAEMILDIRDTLREFE